MQSGGEALARLRECVTKGRPVELKADCVLIDGARFDLGLLTPYRSLKGKGALYKLDALVYFVECFLKQEPPMKYSVYIQSCNRRQKKVRYLPRQDHKTITQYLKSEIEECPYIDNNELARAEAAAAVSRPAAPMATKRQALGQLPTERVWQSNRSASLEHTSINFENLTDRYDRAVKEDRRRAEREEMRKKAREKRDRRGHKRKSTSTPSGEKVPSKRAAPAVKSESARVSRPRLPLRRPPSKYKLPKRRLTPSRDRTVPIILVPNAASSLITIFNAKQLLQDKTFVDSSLAKQSQPQRPSLITIERISARNEEKTVRFFIVDDAKKLSIEEWYQVVAVFSIGKAWQFYDFPYSSHVAVLENMTGFHIHREDVKPSTKVRDWNLTLLPISKHRYEDRKTYSRFWDTLLSAMKVKCSHLAF